MRIDKLADKINKYFDCDIRTKSQSKDVMIPRKIFFVIGKQEHHSLSAMGREVGRSHSMAWVANQTHEDNLTYDKYYKMSFNDFYNYYHEIKPKEENITKVNLKGFDDVLNFSDSERLEFIETRLKPYVMMLKSRKTSKQLINK